MISLSPIHRVFAGFACYSFAMGNIFPRLADVQSGMGVTTAAELADAVGAACTRAVRGALTARWLSSAELALAAPVEAA